MTIQISSEYGGQHAGKLWIPEEASQFENKVSNDKISYSIGLVDITYFRTATELSELGPIGWYQHYNIDRKQDPYPKKYLVLSMSFVVPDDWVPANKELVDSLVITPGGDNKRMNLLHYKHMYDTKQVKMARYKTTLFDKVYPAFREVNPKMTEEEMCRYGRDGEDGYNSDFAEEQEYTGEERCLAVYHGHTRVLSGKLQVTLKILVIDLEPNTPTLLKILSSV